MSASEILEELRRMPEAERRELVETIEMEFGVSDLTADQIAELDRRAAGAIAHPERCRPLEEFMADIAKQYGNKR